MQHKNNKTHPKIVDLPRTAKIPGQSHTGKHGTQTNYNSSPFSPSALSGHAKRNHSRVFCEFMLLSDFEPVLVVLSGVFLSPRSM